MTTTADCLHDAWIAVEVQYTPQGTWTLSVCAICGRYMRQSGNAAGLWVGKN